MILFLKRRKFYNVYSIKQSWKNNLLIFIFVTAFSKVNTFMDKPITILGIESSCDETSAAVIQSNVPLQDALIKVSLLSNVIANQSVHHQYGGVVPELASRAHQQNIVPVVNQALSQANITKSMLDAVAFTQGPGFPL